MGNLHLCTYFLLSGNLLYISGAFASATIKKMVIHFCDAHQGGGQKGLHMNEIPRFLLNQGVLFLFGSHPVHSHDSLGPSKRVGG